MPAWNENNARGPYLTYSNLSFDAISFARSITHRGYTGIVGVPRSGMIVASQVAVFLGLPLYSFDGKGIVAVGGGLRIQRAKPKIAKEKLLVLEDSCASGKSMTNVQSKLANESRRRKIEYGAIYASPATLPLLQVWHKTLPMPHWFEWNWPGSWYFNEMMNLGCDWDGILNRDFTAEEDDDGKLYTKTMMEMEPLLVTNPIDIKFIVTARLEKYRPYCQYWLKRHGMNVQNLVMGPWSTKEERQGNCMGSWKADRLADLGCHLYVESCPVQARVISTRLDIPVICPVLGRSLYKGD